LDDLFVRDLVLRALDDAHVAHALPRAVLELVEVDVLLLGRAVQLHRDVHQAEAERAGPDRPRHRSYLLVPAEVPDAPNPEPRSTASALPYSAVRPVGAAGLAESPVCNRTVTRSLRWALARRGAFEPWGRRASLFVAVRRVPMSVSPAPEDSGDQTAHVA